MNINIPMIINIAIPILGFIVTTYLIPYLKANTTEKQREDIIFWVKIAVKAAEQIYHYKAGAGADKKAHVLQFLNEKGITISEDELDALIEAAVLEINREKESLEQAVQGVQIPLVEVE